MRDAGATGDVHRPTMSTKTLIDGGGHVGHLLVRRTDERPEAVQFVDDETGRRARENGVPAREATSESAGGGSD